MNEQTERGTENRMHAGSLCNDEFVPGAPWDCWQVLCR